MQALYKYEHHNIRMFSCIVLLKITKTKKNFKIEKKSDIFTRKSQVKRTKSHKTTTKSDESTRIGSK